MASPTEQKIEVTTTSGKDQEVSEIVRALNDTQLDDKPSTKVEFSLVDTPEAICNVVDALGELPTMPPSLYVDLEGVNLSRHGSISILQIYVLPTKTTYLIDVTGLRETAFTTATKSGKTLKQVLESEAVPKVFFDVRNDSDALYSHYGIKLAGVQDLQLMEYATRTHSGSYLSGLAKSIERDCPMSSIERQTWKATKDLGLQLFAPERGGTYEVFNERPLSPEIISYCVSDVEFLPRLWSWYHEKLSDTLRAKVSKGSGDRVALSQRPDFNGKGRHMALPPSDW